MEDASASAENAEEGMAMRRSEQSFTHIGTRIALGVGIPLLSEFVKDGQIRSVVVVAMTIDTLLRARNDCKVEEGLASDQICAAYRRA